MIVNKRPNLVAFWIEFGIKSKDNKKCNKLCGCSSKAQKCESTSIKKQVAYLSETMPAIGMAINRPNVLAVPTNAIIFSFPEHGNHSYVVY